MDEFTLLDWIIAGVLFAVGLAGAAAKVFLIDDQETKDWRKKLKR